MPELPEIIVIAKQMDEELAGKCVSEVEDKQPKHLNMPFQEFAKAATGKIVNSVSSRGKWLFIKLDPAYFMLINLGMGAELLYFKSNSEIPENSQFKLTFVDKTGFTIHFWWFGHVHLVREKDLGEHELTSKLGTSPIDKQFTLDYFKRIVTGKKMRVKSFLLDQKNLSGIGNVYVQDILFKAELHPARKLSSLSDKEVDALHKAICGVLNYSIKRGGASFELDFHGKKGKFTPNEFLVGYKTGKPCPRCNTIIEKIRTGSTASYICPQCQKEK